MLIEFFSFKNSSRK